MFLRGLTHGRVRTRLAVSSSELGGRPAMREGAHILASAPPPPPPPPWPGLGRAVLANAAAVALPAGP